jgi:hypothetical protein
MSDNYEERKRLTFEQAEGAEPLPTQRRTKELSAQLRALLWEIFYYDTGFPDNKSISGSWEGLLYRYYVDRRHRPADEFHSVRFFMEEIKATFLSANYIGVLGFIQWIRRRQEPSSNLREYIEEALRESRAAYRIFDRDTIVPVGSDAEEETLKRAFADVTASEFHGARSHLHDAGSKLTEGDYAGSIRESIHAGESVARVLEPGTSALAPALAKLEKSAGIHGALKTGFRGSSRCPRLVNM